MTKRLLAFLFFTLLSAELVACGNNKTENSRSPKESIETETSQRITVEEITLDNTEISHDSQAIEENPQNTPENKPEHTLNDIENYLLDQGLLSGERTQMAAGLIGGIDGFKYSSSAGEIYEYDVNSDAYKKLSNGESITLEGMEGYSLKAFSTNGKFVLFGENIPQELIDAFDAFN